MTRIFYWFFMWKMDPMSGCDIPLVFTLPPRDSTLQYKRCVHFWNNFPCIITLALIRSLGIAISDASKLNHVYCNGSRTQSKNPGTKHYSCGEAEYIKTRSLLSWKYTLHNMFLALDINRKLHKFQKMTGVS